MIWVSLLRNEIECFLLWRVFHLLHCSDRIDSDRLIVSVVTDTCQGMTFVIKIQPVLKTEFREALRWTSRGIIATEIQRVGSGLFLIALSMKLDSSSFCNLEFYHVALIYETISILNFHLRIARYWSNDLKHCT